MHPSPDPVCYRDQLELLKKCGGFYQCPKGPDGKRLGPLVGYAGRYGDDNLQFVGEVYVNFAAAERHAKILNSIVERLYQKLLKHPGSTVVRDTGFIGAPLGGLALATALSLQGDGQYIFPEKKIVAMATATSREKSKLVFDRHQPGPGERWWIVEDVCNNFSTTEDLVALVEATGAEVAGITCFLNRSTAVDDWIHIRPSLGLPVVSLVRHAFEQFRQNDAFVADDVVADNVVWKPKNDWARLEAAMVAATPKA